MRRWYIFDKKRLVLLDKIVLHIESCLGAERGAGEQREVARGWAAGCSSRAGRVSTEGSSSQCGDEPHSREWWCPHLRHRRALHGEQVCCSFKKIILSSTSVIGWHVEAVIFKSLFMYTCCLAIYSYIHWSDKTLWPLTDQLNKTNYLFIVVPVSEWDVLESKWTFCPQSWCVGSRKNTQA